MNAGQLSGWDLINLPVGDFLMRPCRLSAQTEMVNAKTAFTLTRWQNFDSNAQHYLMSVREQLENMVLYFRDYKFIRQRAPHEVGLYSVLDSSLFSAVNDVATRLNLGMIITNGSGMPLP